MNFSYLCIPVGFGGGMVDTRDLKSLGQECLYGFESRPKHHYFKITMRDGRKTLTVILFHN